MHGLRNWWVVTLAVTLLALGACADTDTTDGDVSVEVESLSVTAEVPLQVTLGDLLLTATAVYEDGSTEEVSDSVQWTTSDPEVASVSATGQVSGLASGTATFTATDPESGVAGHVTVDITPAVLDPVLDALMITAELPLLQLLGELVLTVTAVYQDGSTADVTGLVDWASSDPDIATVSVLGIVTGLSTGSVTISATDPATGTEAEITLDVVDGLLEPVLEALDVSVELPLLGFLGETVVTAIAVFDDGSSLDVSHLVDWASSDPEIASVSALGIVTGLSAGSVTISATDPETGIAGSAALEVLGPLLEALDVSVELPVLGFLGETVATAIATFEDGSTLDVSHLVEWVSSDPEIAEVSALGIVTGLSAGSTTIAAIDPETGTEGSAAIEVLGPLLEAIDVSAELPVLAILQEMQLTAIGTYEDGSTADVTELVDWASSDPEIAEVSALGIVTGLSAGTVTLTATDPETGTETSYTLDVLGPLLESIEISPGSVSILLGETVQLSATGHYSDGSTADLTDVVDWEASGSLIEINLGGLVLGLSLGSTDVTAIDPATGLSATSVVNVVLSLL